MNKIWKRYKNNYCNDRDRRDDQLCLTINAEWNSPTREQNRTWKSTERTRRAHPAYVYWSYNSFQFFKKSEVYQ